jgi:RNA polymerase sigma factor (sigma-70 family)
MPQTSASRGQREEQLRELFNAHADAVRRYALRRGEADDADDVVAETFLVAWRRLEGVPETAALPWLLTVAGNALRNQRRGGRRRRALMERLLLDRREPAAAPTHVDAESSPTMRAFGRLGETDRETLRLIAWDALTPSDAAAVAGCTAAAFRVRLHRARRHLEAELRAVDPTRSLRPTLPTNSGCGERT